MFKYTKRLFSDIRFWCREIKIRRAENAEWERIEDETEYGICHPMTGFAYFQTMSHNRAERKRIHEQEKRAMQ